MDLGTPAQVQELTKVIKWSWPGSLVGQWRAQGCSWFCMPTSMQMSVTRTLGKQAESQDWKHTRPCQSSTVAFCIPWLLCYSHASYRVPV